MTPRGRSWFPEIPAAARLFAARPNLFAYPPAALLTGFGYALLQAWFSVGIVGLWVLRFLTAPQWILAIGFAALFPWLVLLDIFLWRHPSCRTPSATGDPQGTTVAAAILGILPNALCCTPIVPSVLALFVSGSTLVSISAPVQHALATFELEFFLLSLVLLWLAIRIASRQALGSLEQPNGGRAVIDENDPGSVDPSAIGP